MTTKKTNSKPAPQPKEPERTPLEKFHEALAGLSAEEVANLKGFVIPRGETAEPTFGYRCRNCNNIAFYFIGDKFLDSAGNEVDSPPAGVDVGALPIDWDREEPISRGDPKCQKCGHQAELRRKTLQLQLVVRVKPWLASRDAALEAQKKLKAAQGPGLSVAASHQSITDHSGGVHTLVDNPNPNANFSGLPGDPEARKAISDSLDSNRIYERMFNR